MTAKEYLNQAYRLDQRINSKTDQIESLNAIARKCTASITGMPRKPNAASAGMSDTVDQIIDLQEEIQRDIARLVELRREIVTAIKTVRSPEYQTLLEKRYLCFMAWEQIAVDMNYSIDSIFKIHRKALNHVPTPKTGQ